MTELKIINHQDLRDWANELFKKNSFNMVDVSSKKQTFRRALASGSIRVGREVLDLIKRLKDQGIAVLLISHRMPDIFEVCEKLVVLRRGEKVCEKKIKDSSTEEATGLITGAIDRV